MDCHEKIRNKIDFFYKYNKNQNLNLLFWLSRFPLDSNNFFC